MLGRLKRFFVLGLAGMLVLEGAVPSVLKAEQTEGINREITSNVLSDRNSNFEGGEDAGKNPNWWYGSGATITVSSNSIEGDYSMLVEPNQAGNWVGGASNISAKVEADTTYEYSFDAKLAGEEGTEGSVLLGTKFVYTTNPWNDGVVMASVDDTYSFTTDNWTTVTGTFTTTAPEGSAYEELHLFFTSDSTTPFYVDNLKVGKKESGEVVLGDNLIHDPQFSEAGNDWYASASVAEMSKGSFAAAEDIAEYGTGYATITGRTQNWECIAQDIESRVENNTDYQFSFYAKLSDDYGTESRTVQLCTTLKDDKDGGANQYDKLTMTGGTAQVTASGWTKVEGTLHVAWTGELQKLTFKISEQGAALSAETFGSYSVANVSMQKIDAPEKEIQKELKDLKQQFADDFNGKAGVAIPVSALQDTARMELVTKHFDSVTAENEMKPESLLGQTYTAGENGFPALNFDNADALMNAIQEYNQANPSDTPIKVRGHVLVWHSQTPEWFFHEDYDAAKPYASAETMTARMEEYIKQVMDHFEGEESPYKGMIYAWDVVNEAINDSNGGLRTESDNPGSNWYRIYQNDTFITNAFVFANRYAPADVKLFYNDYNETNGTKAAGICELIKKIKATPDARIDGMGMQAHYDMTSPSMGQFTSAAKAYAEALGEGGEIQLTELDLKSSNDYDGTDVNAEYQKQAYRYKAFYDVILGLKGEGVNFTTITFWGTHDGASWLQSSNSVGGAADGTRKQCPLLFDDNYQAKPAYYAFVSPEVLEPNIHKTVAVNTTDFANAVNTYQFTAAETDTEVIPVWNKQGLQVKVTVKDTTVEATDQVTVYVDTTDARKDASETIKKVTVKRADAISTAEGYTAIVTVDVPERTVGKTVGFDVAVTNGTETGYYNDLTGKQETSSKFYASLVMKPFMEIKKASVTVDGKADAVWSKVEAVPFTISAGAKAEAEAKLLWDDENLYVLATVKDAVLDKQSSQAHEQDSVEVFIDENNHKSDGYEADDKQYRVNYENEASFNGTNCKAENVTSAVTVTKDGYMLEAAYKWTEITPEELAKIGVELQINDAENGTRIGTASWYDESGQGWSTPSVFGTAVLGSAVEADKPDPKPDTPNPGEGETAKEYFANFSVSSVKIQKGKSSNALAQDLKIEETDEVVSWTSSDKKIVTVSASGKIKGVKTGKAIITVTTKMGKEASVTVKVVKNTIKTTKLVVKNGDTDAVIKSGKKMKLQKKETLQLKAGVTPITSPEKVKYTSSNKKVVSVSKSGLITAKKKGSATVTVSSGSKKVKIKVTVK